MLPRRLIRSWNSRLGCTGAESCALIPVPATRSIASFGLTYILTPAKESPAANNKKITKLNTNAMVLNLDIRDVLHDEKSNHLQGHRAAQHDIADVVQEEEAHVVRVGVKREHRDPDGNATER